MNTDFIKGVVVPIITPIDEAEKIDEARFRRQIDYVIGEWKQQEIDEIQPRLDVAVEMIKSFVAIGPDLTMNQYNNK